MENRAEFRLGKRIFLGILGNLGSKIDLRDLSKMTRASGLNGHGKRGKTQEKWEEMSKFSGNPRILLIGGLRSLGTRGVRSYAARTRTSCMTEASTASASDGTGCRVRGSDGTAGRTGRIGRRWRSKAKSFGYAGRTGVRSAYPDEDADSSSDKVRILI